MLIETDYRALISAGQEGLPLRACGSVVAIGNFDGVHLGHQALLAEGRRQADALGVPLVVLTFSPHPRFFFKPEQPPFLLSDSTLKTEVLLQYGADSIVQLGFDIILASVTAEEFIRHVLVEGLQAKHVIVGDNFMFGHRRGGDVALLKTAGQKHLFGVTAMPAVNDFMDLRVSSERVREALRNGHLASAEDLLGRQWMLRGHVIHGDKRGRTIGYPTANMMTGDFLQPKFGIYAAHVTIEETNETHKAAVNFGIRPMFETPAPLLEAYLLDFDGDLYGKTLRIAFAEFLRPEQKFLGMDNLTAQIEKDVIQVREMLPSN